jgi:superfamily I DNA/RNA helicase
MTDNPPPTPPRPPLIWPPNFGIETVGDDGDLQEVYDTERHLLYVACTRARDHLLVCGVAPVSEFLDDFVKSDESRAAHG